MQFLVVVVMERVNGEDYERGAVRVGNLEKVYVRSQFEI